MSILVTGGFGFVGQWITDALVAAGKDVCVLSRRASSTEKNVTFVRCDLTSIDQCHDQLRHREFEYVIHLASLNESTTENYFKLALEVNTLGTRNLIASLNTKKLKQFIYFSTFHVYGVASGRIEESTVPSPKNDYALTHWFAEELVRQSHVIHNIPYAILRLTNGYGCPGTVDTDKWYLLLNDLVKGAFQQGVIRLSTNGLAQRDFIWLGDVCGIVSQILDDPMPLNDTFNLGSGETLRLLNVAECVRDAFRLQFAKSIDVVLNEQDESIHEEPLVVDVSKLKARFRWEPQNRLTDEAIRIFDLLKLEDQRS